MNSTFIDIHSHQSEEKIFPGITRIENLIVGQSDATTLTNNQLYSAGIHPWYIYHTEEQIQALSLIAKNNNIIAIGECGLDKVKGAPWNQQVEIFKYHISLSEETHKPLIIHNVRATEEIIALHKKIKPTQKWIIHGFRSTAKHAGKLIETGLYLSFGNYITQNPDKYWPLLTALPTEKIFFETDEADSHRIIEIYTTAALILNMNISYLQEQVAQNLENCFGRNK